MEKQKLGKHHFWILLALAMVLIPVVIGGAAFGVGSAANKEREKVEAEVKKLNQAAPKGQNYIAGLKEQEKHLQQRRNEVWKLSPACLGAWSGQRAARISSLRWPSTAFCPMIAISPTATPITC